MKRPMITIDECMSMSEKELNEFLDRDEKLLKESIINECVDRCLRKYLNENTKYSIPKFLYHATPSCYLSSIKKNGLGGKIPRKRFWDYDNTEYANIRKGCFLATDEYVAESYLDASDEFETFSEWYEERYGKELNIVVFKIPTSNLDLRLLKIDTNQLIDAETEPTYFYDGVIPYNQMSIIQLY